ncbi:hypothetical protein M409DRAFT_71202 [Zasmidium cellare ATCC 36951]|uniref:Major facilitator superfamily (MFS) profile domain-containing protein n=1 Tax=Zasmidium cellare ATCC 36951 TaxID=1080233 RepID=A0A6A6BWQ0_ZASCE|nr:uncharacterized protein M409DRAFT_71202 [Zasmidium cellare ATCC 36951]KAF2159207.1 hypothetical protein M409DRAFT_71202 [Zasmidium cellare ATCC 36951]
MGIGVLEPKSDAVVPGTVLLQDHGDDTTVDNDARGNNEEVILEPQPSNDPNDPLNWPLGKKVAMVMIVYLGAVVHSGTTAPLLISGNVQISKDLHIPLSKMVQLSLGYFILAAGAICPFIAAFARKYGKRPVYVLSSIVATVGCIVGATASGYNSLLAARILQGIGQAACETLTFNTIGDVLFVHQRGLPVALGVLCINVTINIVGIISGAITTRLGWRYCFWILLPFAIIQMLLAFFFVAETSYRRNSVDRLNAGHRSKLHSTNDASSVDANYEFEEQISRDDTLKDNASKLENVVSHQASENQPTRKSWIQELRLYNGPFADDPMWKIFLAFPAVLLNLGVSFAVFSCGLCLTWFGGTVTIASILFPAPPYNYTTIQVGYASVAPAIGSLLASIFMGLTLDHLVSKLTRHNRGVYEPEFQLPLTFAGGACVIAGMVSTGYTFGKGSSVYIVSVCWAIASFGFACCNVTYFNYALSAYSDYTVEIIVMSVMFRNFLGYVLSLFVVPWLERNGPLVVYSSLAGTIAATLLLVGAFYVLGKRYRLFWHRHNLLQRLQLEAKKPRASE